MAMKKTSLRYVIALASVSALALTACGGSTTGGSTGGATSASGAPITFGTTDKVSSLDPAGSYDNGSFMVMNQIFPFVLNSKPGGATPEPDIAVSASFTSPTAFTVKLKPGLKWSNGHVLDSADVKFSFDRQLKINDANGPATLLGNLASVDAPDPTTVVFNLKAGNDQTFEQILTSPAGVIVDNEVFPADKIMSDDAIIAAKAFAGQYTIASYKKNEVISFKAYPGYDGLLGKPQSDNVIIKYYSDSNRVVLDDHVVRLGLAQQTVVARVRLEADHLVLLVRRDRVLARERLGSDDGVVAHDLVRREDLVVNDHSGRAGQDLLESLVVARLQVEDHGRRIRRIDAGQVAQQGCRAVGVVDLQLAVEAKLDVRGIEDVPVGPLESGLQLHREGRGAGEGRAHSYVWLRSCATWLGVEHEREDLVHHHEGTVVIGPSGVQGAHFVRGAERDRSATGASGSAGASTGGGPAAGRQGQGRNARQSNDVAQARLFHSHLQTLSR